MVCKTYMCVSTLARIASRPSLRESLNVTSKLRIKLTGAEQDFREEVREADVVRLCTFYVIYGTI